MNIPTHLNGHLVIQSAVHSVCATVMVFRKNDAMPYVVATWWEGLGSKWSWGHYSADLETANREFAAASARNAMRI